MFPKTDSVSGFVPARNECGAGKKSFGFATRRDVFDKIRNMSKY